MYAKHLAPCLVYNKHQGKGNKQHTPKSGGGGQRKRGLREGRETGRKEREGEERERKERTGRQEGKTE